MRTDPHAVLGIDPGSTPAEIKRAYRRLARALHPDRNPDPAAVERLKRVNAAYAALMRTPSTPPLRATARRAAPTRQAADPLETAFGEILGAADTSRPPARGTDLELQIDVGLLESIQGGERRVRLRGYQPCDACRGRAVDCPACNGEGRRAAEWERLVEIPSGVVDGTELRVRGGGSAGRGRAPAGDLLVRCKLRLPAGWRREGRDIRVALRLGALRAALGGPIRLDLPDGRATLTVPRGTRTGASICLPGRGLPPLRGSRRGDLHFDVTLTTPTGRDRRGRAALQAALDAGVDGPTEIEGS